VVAATCKDVGTQASESKYGVREARKPFPPLRLAGEGEGGGTCKDPRLQAGFSIDHELRVRPFVVR
jgi:hypothetical protein